MNTKRTLVYMYISSALAALAMSPQSAAADNNPPPPACGITGCRDNEGLIFQRLPAVPAATGGSSPMAGQPAIDLPQGGVIWAIEDSTLTIPVLNVQAGSLAPFENGRIVKPVRFHSYSNYASFIDRIEVTLYRGTDVDRVSPLATIDVPVGGVADADWDGQLPEDIRFRAGDSLLYVARAYGHSGAFDETQTQTIQLVSPQDFERGLSTAQDEAQRTLGQSLDADAAQNREVSLSIYGQNALRLQNIPIHGSRVRVQGHDLATGTRLAINGQSFPVDREGKFVAEFLEPVGQHRYDVAVAQTGAPPLERSLQVDVTGRYAYAVALADLTLSKSNVSGNLDPLAGDYRYTDDFLSEGRLAFYAKGKARGRYLFTAHADTRENKLSRLFNGFLDADANDVFWRLDPDQYYPVYGDDSTAWRDVDTQGRLYLRVDWDQSQALWGNFATGITGTEYAQYTRSLYGAALNWRAPATTPLGDPRSLLKVFVSEAQSAAGHSEFLGTGGSLYYLRHTDVLRGSEQVIVEIRDPTTGRVENRTTLQRGADYELDELQGRIILTRPLSQISRENVRTLTRDTPLDGYDQVLMVDYEYVPSGFKTDDVALGLRGKQWLGDHFAVGGTYIDENRSGDDYSLKGVDMTLQAGRGTYLKAEASRTESTAAPVFFSDNGGLDFTQLNTSTATRKGDARAVEARANFKELGWTAQDWSAGAWWRRVDSGFSISSLDYDSDIKEYGAEFLGYFNQNFSLFGRYTRAERNAQVLEQQQLTADWRISQNGRLGAELRRISERYNRADLSDVNALLAAISYRHMVTDQLELSGTGQYTVDDDSGAYDRNNLVTLGAKYLFGDRSSIGAEVSSGSRGHGGSIDGEYRLGPNQTVYGGYNYTTDRTVADPLFNNRLQSGWTLGQRWRVSDRVNVYNESQFLKDTRSETSGLAHTFGLDFMPIQGWSVGFTAMDGKLDAVSGQVDRRAYSVSVAATDPRTVLSSKLEYRKDTGAERREQWVTTNRLTYKVNDDWRIAARGNYADTQDELNPQAGAKLIEANVGFAWRPHDNTRWALFGKYTFLYDVATLGQDGGNTYDQRSRVLSLEGVSRISARWELAAKAAMRRGDYRVGRGEGDWLDSRVEFYALQARYRLFERWDAMGEYRYLAVKDGGDRKGWLVGVDRRIGENFKVGAGYNFTEFSDDLTELEYKHRGWFVNLAGYY